MNRPYPAFVVSKKGEKFLSGGHIWVYENELLNAPACADGEIADVYSEKGRYLGSGFYNRHSKSGYGFYPRMPTTVLRTEGSFCAGSPMP